MSSNSRKLLEAITCRINKLPVLSSAIENATGSAQVRMTNMQNIATKKYDAIVKHVNGATIIQNLKSTSLESSATIPKPLIHWWQWYQQITGLEDVELAKRQMIIVQDKLFDCQDRRRNLTNEVSTIADKLKNIYGELIQTKREDPKYVHLTIMENKALQEQNKIMSQMSFLENEERDYFTQLATAIKEYHDSQTMNAQKYKYLSILASALIAILSLGASIIYNNKRLENVHKIVTTGQKENEALFRNHFHSLEKSLEKISNDKWSPQLNNLLIKEPQDESNSTLLSNRTILIGSLCIILFLCSRMSS